MSEPVQAREALLIGYARVSTDLENLDLQLDALADAGSGRVYRDTRTGRLRCPRRGTSRIRTGLRRPMGDERR
jgi:hypothetical protein